MLNATIYGFNGLMGISIYLPLILCLSVLPVIFHWRVQLIIHAVVENLKARINKVHTRISIDYSSLQFPRIAKNRYKCEIYPLFITNPNQVQYQLLIKKNHYLSSVSFKYTVRYSLSSKKKMKLPSTYTSRNLC